MQIGDTVFQVIGTSPEIKRTVLRRGHPGSFTTSINEPYGRVEYYNFGQIFDNQIEADRAIIRNINQRVSDLQQQIAILLVNRDAVMARLEI